MRHGNESNADWNLIFRKMTQNEIDVFRRKQLMEIDLIYIEEVFFVWNCILCMEATIPNVDSMLVRGPFDDHVVVLTMSDSGLYIEMLTLMSQNYSFTPCLFSHDGHSRSHPACEGGGSVSNSMPKNACAFRSFENAITWMQHDPLKGSRNSIPSRAHLRPPITWNSRGWTRMDEDRRGFIIHTC